MLPFSRELASLGSGTGYQVPGAGCQRVAGQVESAGLML